MQKELQLIQELMQELQDKMSYGKEDFEERLGRSKPPGIEVMKVEGELPMEGDSDDLEQDNEMVEGEGEMELGDEPDMDPRDSMLKKRLMKLRA